MKLIKLLVKKNIPIIVLLLISSIVYFRWLSFNIFLHGDWGLHYAEQLSANLAPYLWQSSAFTGQIDPTPFRAPITFITSLLSYITSGGSNITDKFIFFWPQIFLLPLFSYLLIERITKNQIGSLVGAIVFSFNAYYLTINTAGHNMITVGTAFCVFGLYFTIIAIQDKKLFFFNWAALFLAVGGWYDFRILYLTVWIVILLLTTVKESYFRSIKNGIFLFSGIALLNIFWLLPIPFLSTGFSSEILSRSLFGDQFWSLSYAFSLMHPFWTGMKPEWFSTQLIPISFWLIPLIAISVLLIKRKNLFAIIFALVGVVGIFLTKQSDAPLEWVYPALFKMLPGFNAFREASKFYFYITLSYSILIAFFVTYIWELKEKFTVYTKSIIIFGIAFLFLWNTYPIISGDIETMFVPRTANIDYEILRGHLNNSDSFFRTLWVPRTSKWVAFNVVHPQGSAIDLFTLNLTQLEFSTLDLKPYDRIILLFKKKWTKNLMEMSSVRYIGVPIKDVENDDDVFAYYGGRENPQIRQWYIDELDKISWLKKIDIGTKELVIYENEGYKPPIFGFNKMLDLNSLENLDAKYTFINDKLGDEFYFTSEDRELASKKLVNLDSIFEKFEVGNGYLSDIRYSDPEKENTFYINSTSTNIAQNISMNDAPVSAGLISGAQESKVFKYTSPEYNLQNVIPNPSFESGSWQEKVGDCNNYDDNPILAMSLNSEESTDGVNSLQLEATRHIACTSIRVPVKGESTYLLSFDYQSPNSKNASYYLGFNDEDKTKISEKLPIKTTEWNSFSKIIKIPFGATEISVFVYARSTDEKINIINRYDNFKLIEIPDLTDAYYLVSEPKETLVEPRAITFDLVNPTKKLVHIKGATTPFFLAMSESYHDKWQLQMNNDKVQGRLDSWVPFVSPDRVADEYHYKLNDFLNGWYIEPATMCKEGNMACTLNADGSYDMEMVIEFFPQRWFYLGLLISGTTLAGCLGYLGYDFVRRRRKSSSAKSGDPDAESEGLKLNAKNT